MNIVLSCLVAIAMHDEFVIETASPTNLMEEPERSPAFISKNVLVSDPAIDEHDHFSRLKPRSESRINRLLCEANCVFGCTTRAKINPGAKPVRSKSKLILIRILPPIESGAAPNSQLAGRRAPNVLDFDRVGNSIHMIGAAIDDPIQDFTINNKSGQFYVGSKIQPVAALGFPQGDYAAPNRKHTEGCGNKKGQGTNNKTPIGIDNGFLGSLSHFLLRYEIVFVPLYSILLLFCLPALAGILAGNGQWRLFLFVGLPLVLLGFVGFMGLTTWTVEGSPLIALHRLFGMD